MAKMTEETKRYLKFARKNKKHERYRSALYLMLQAQREFDKTHVESWDRNTTDFQIERLDTILKVALKQLKAENKLP